MPVRAVYAIAKMDDDDDNSDMLKSDSDVMDSKRELGDAVVDGKSDSAKVRSRNVHSYVRERMSKTKVVLCLVVSLLAIVLIVAGFVLLKQSSG